MGQIRTVGEPRSVVGNTDNGEEEVRHVRVDIKVDVEVDIWYGLQSSVSG